MATPARFTQSGPLSHSRAVAQAGYEEAGDPSLRDSFRAEPDEYGYATGVVDNITGAPGVAATDDQFTKWTNRRRNRMRPVMFHPTGSFKHLKDLGKLVEHKEVGTLGTRGLPGDDASQEIKKHLPGYTGFVRGEQHISGRTFGETTRRALATDYREVVCTSPIPAAPQANRKIPQAVLADTFVTNMTTGKTSHVPGYTGFVPGIRATHAKSYGSATSAELLKLSQKFPRDRSLELAGRASTAHARKEHHVDSAPLPGGVRTNLPPDKLIPVHLRYLRF